MDFRIIAVPICEGSNKVGVEHGPKTLMKEGVLELFTKNGHYVDEVIEIKKNDIVPLRNINKGIRNYKSVFTINLSLAREVDKCIKDGVVPFVIGGDHSLGIGSLAGVLNNYDDFAILWIDAHADINTESTSFSGNAHGMPLAFSIGLGDKNIRTMIFKNKKINPNNIYIIGARDIDVGEQEIIEKKSVNIFSVKDAKLFSLQKVIKTIANDIRSKGITKLYFSFDVDSMDPNLIPGTGTPVSNGFTLEDAHIIFSILRDDFEFIYFDFVELNPLIEYTKTVKNCLFLLDVYTKGIKKTFAR